jgi:putative aldouronate transport system permease protein
VEEDRQERRRQPISHAAAAGVEWAVKANFGAEVVKHRHYYVLLLPAVVLFLMFRYVPMAGVLIAFKKYTVLGGLFGSEWAGLDNFRQMFSTTLFYQVLWNTVKISVLNLAFGFPAPILFAVLLNEMRQLRPKKVFQSISYLPHFVSWVVAGGLIRDVLSLRGPVNLATALFGVQPVIFLQRADLFVPILVITNIWKNVGWGSIIYLAAMAGIDPQLYEAAQIDGASRVQRILSITLPSIVHVIVILFLLRIGHILDAGFDQIFNLYNPLVYRVGDIVDTYVYRVGIGQLRYSFAAAVGLSKNVVGLILMLIMNRVTKTLSGESTVV